jgi:F420-dependent oxidoreductase-like protein
MRLSVHYWNFSTPGGAARIAPNLRHAAQAADQGGISAMTLMDRCFQMEARGTADEPMLEGYTGLGYLAGITKQLRLGLLVTGVTYRHPGLLAKIVATLDVLSEGRAFLGIGAAWYEREHLALGVPYPPLKERFERLEETLQICRQMWSDDDGPYEGTHYRLAETLCSPRPLQTPRPPILIGGGGEKKTLRLVAQYADSCNLFPGPEVQHKLDVLKQHCEDVGRDYDEIEKTVIYNMDLGEKGSRVGDVVEQMRRFAALGFTVTHGSVRNAYDTSQFEIFQREVLPAVADL